MTIVRTVHQFLPYPFSTGEAWCRLCGMEEAAHLLWTTQAQELIRGFFAGHFDHLTGAEFRQKLEEAQRD